MGIWAVLFLILQKRKKRKKEKKENINNIIGNEKNQIYNNMVGGNTPKNTQHNVASKSK
jgi:hypothetical protein